MSIVELCSSIDISVKNKYEWIFANQGWNLKIKRDVIDENRFSVEITNLSVEVIKLQIGFTSTNNANGKVEWNSSPGDNIDLDPRQNSGKYTIFVRITFFQILERILMQ